jgi:uncharacterized protein YjeT (DUF2065 family)
VSEFAIYITTSIALIFILEGLLYALFPENIRKLMEVALSLPPEKLKFFGTIMVFVGLTMIFILQSLT